MFMASRAPQRNAQSFPRQRTRFGQRGGGIREDKPHSMANLKLPVPCPTLEAVAEPELCGCCFFLRDVCLGILL